MERILVIAEIGSSHDGNLDNAMSLIDIAADAGCDAAKIQYWSDPFLLAKRRHMNDSSAYEKYMVPFQWLAPLRSKAKERNLSFLSSVFLPSDVATVAPFVDRFKVASLEASAQDLRDEIMKHKKPVIVSTGAHSQRCVRRGPWLGPRVQRAKYLLCVSSYPAPIEQLNLARLCMEPSGYFPFYDGFSDHSGHVLTGALAVACGAEIVEVHIRNVTTPRDNPDWPHSHGPKALGEYVANIRFAEQAIGEPAIGKLGYSYMPCEEPMRKHRVLT